MRNLLMSVGDFQFFDEPSNKGGLIAGKIVAINPLAEGEITRSYKRFHTGKTDKFNVLAKLIMELVPPDDEEEKEENEESNTEEELGDMDTAEEEQQEEIV